MFPRRFLFIALAAFVILAIVLSNGAAQQQAWQQGYLMGRLSAEGGNSGGAGQLAPFLMPGPYGYGGFAGPHFGGFGSILLLGLLFFAGLAALRFFFGGYRHGGPWGRHGWGQPGHRPPWADWGDQPNPEQAPDEGSSERWRA